MRLTHILTIALLIGCSGKADDSAEGTTAGTTGATTTGSTTSGTTSGTTGSGGSSGTSGTSGTTATSGSTTGGTTATYHPKGYSADEVHGLDAKLGSDDCTSCHGADLTGDGAAVSCDTCHSSDWRTDCVFCHGGTDNETGAPPEDIDGTTDAASSSFSPHTSHVTASANHAAFECEQCHAQPEDILSAGHVFIDDSTPGVAESDFSAGLSAATTWDSKTLTCNNTYCHGTGQGDDGSSTVGDKYSCTDCHATADSDIATINSMSGEHAEHISEDVGCHECHGDVINSDGVITAPELHVSGAPDVTITKLEASNSGSGWSCSGRCHDEGHGAESWED